MDFLVSQTFWTATAAIVAFFSLFLSQLPPIKYWFKKRQPNLSISPVCGVNHYMGNPEVHLYLTIQNDSPHKVNIKSISLNITDPGGNEKELQAFAYYSSSTIDPNLKSFAPFSLESGKEWGNTIKFFKPYSGVNDTTMRRIVMQFKKIVADCPHSNGPIDCLSYDANLATDVYNMYENNKYWIEGAYKLELVIDTGNPKTSIRKKIHFTLYQIDLQSLREVFYSDIKYGANILYKSDNHAVFPNIDLLN